MKTTLGIIAVIIGIVGYIPYFRDMIAHKTKPHAFTWFIWTVLTGIAFFAQVHDGGGPGAWVTGVTTLISIIITVVAFRVGRQNIVRVDWYFLAGALAALAVWAITDDPVWSVILITIIDAIAFVPTFRKSYHKPYEETLFTFTMSGLKYIFGIAALSVFTVTTVLYPLSLVITNMLFVAMLVMRRRSQAATINR